MNERQERKLQYIKEQTVKRIKALRDILEDEDDRSTRASLINRVAVIEDWARRLLMTHQLRYMLNNTYMCIMYMNFEEARCCLAKLGDEVDDASNLSGYDSLHLFDEDATAEEIDHYLYDFARERMRRTPNRVFDKETQEKYGVREWRNGYLVNQYGEDEPDDMPGMSVIELLELSEL